MTKPQFNWDLSQWLSHLEHRASQEIQLGLERISKVVSSLFLDKHFPVVITVAGTNGKGSTVTALEAIYLSAGYTVGVYTSPHLLHFNERIRVNRADISDKELCSLFSEVEERRGSTFLTYFETTTVAALLHFKRQAVDVVLLEVGLGGRLDATNCVDADLAIITTIDFDHQEYLGKDLESIGFEKAGILRAGKPFVYADENIPLSVIEVANTLKTQSLCLGREYAILNDGPHWRLQLKDPLHYGLKWNNELVLPLPSIQLKSAAAAIIASLALSKRLPVTQDQISQSMQRIYVPARLELKRGVISVLYDVSHNAQSALLLAEYLKKLDWKGRIHAVFSALKDKDILQLILPLKDCVHRWFPAQLDNKRAESSSNLLLKFAEAHISVNFCYNTPVFAFKEAFNQASEGDLIVVFGSFYTVAQVLESVDISSM